MFSEPFPRPPPCITQGVLNKAQLFEFDAITQLSRHLQGESAVHLMILSPQTTGSKPGLTFSKLQLLALIFAFTLTLKPGQLELTDGLKEDIEFLLAATAAKYSILES